jgi:hypothetical protein
VYERKHLATLWYQKECTGIVAITVKTMSDVAFSSDEQVYKIQ